MKKENRTIKMNAIKGCFRREILRYLHEPGQTIFNVIFSNLLFFVILFFLNSKQVNLLIPGMLMYSGFSVIFSNMKMTLFVGRIENTISYQLSSCISRITLYFIYIISSVIRAVLISAGIYVILMVIFPEVTTYRVGAFIVWTLFSDFVFANCAVLLTLFLKNWNSVGAVENYIVTPMLYLGGCLFSVKEIPEICRIIVYINPIFHFVNVSKYLFSNITEFNISISILICIVFLIASTLACLILFKKGIKLLK